eukprot:COSAG02_NODE_1953_length_10277_cov_3.865003_1_plen_54_part_00
MNSCRVCWARESECSTAVRVLRVQRGKIDGHGYGRRILHILEKRSADPGRRAG